MADKRRNDDDECGWAGRIEAFNLQKWEEKQPEAFVIGFPLSPQVGQ